MRIASAVHFTNFYLLSKHYATNLHDICTKKKDLVPVFFSKSRMRFGPAQFSIMLVVHLNYRYLVYYVVHDHGIIDVKSDPISVNLYSTNFFATY